MATREENIKKINEQLEQLSDEQLDQVAGGVGGPSVDQWGGSQKKYYSDLEKELEQEKRNREGVPPIDMGTGPARPSWARRHHH